MLADPALDAALRTALGADHAALEEVTSVVFPTELSPAAESYVAAWLP